MDAKIVSLAEVRALRAKKEHVHDEALVKKPAQGAPEWRMWHIACAAILASLTSRKK